MKRILIIYTGGTIGMHHDSTGVLKPFDFGKITEIVPDLKRIKCTIDHFSFIKLIDSSNVTIEFWKALVKVIETNYKKQDGFVVLHGTDTMAYSASALSFMLENLSKPIIFTGSQLPLGAIRTDAKRNLITSVELAASKILIPEVTIYFNNQLFRGNRVEKFTSSKFDAFQSLNYPCLAEAGVEIVINQKYLLSTPSKKMKVNHLLDSNIALVRLFPGISAAWLKSTLSVRGLKALILETYGSGNAPTEPWFIQILADAIKKGIVIVNVSQCSGGKVEQGKYETSYRLKEIGVISGSDMTTEAALTKLMVLFGKKLTVTQIRSKMTQSLAGELSLD